MHASPRSYDIDSIDIGASIACDGVCLTVVALGTAARGLVRRRDLGRDGGQDQSIGRNGWPAGRRINLERALKVGDELGGHIVSGHVDGVAEVTEIRERATARG